MPIYFTLSIYRVLLSGGVRAEHSKPYSKRGALLYCVGLSETRFHFSDLRVYRDLAQFWPLLRRAHRTQRCPIQETHRTSSYRRFSSNWGQMMLILIP